MSEILASMEIKDIFILEDFNINPINDFRKAEITRWIIINAQSGLPEKISSTEFFGTKLRFCFNCKKCLVSSDKCTRDRQYHADRVLYLEARVFLCLTDALGINLHKHKVTYGF